MRNCYISVDIESTGPTPGSYSMYELGACVVGNEEIRLEQKLILLPETKFSLGALRAVETTEKKLYARKNTVNAIVAMKRFANWVKSVSQGAHPVFVANNAPFDWMFVCWYFEEFCILNPFEHSALDMKAFFMGMTRCRWSDATLANMARHAKITFNKLPHRAIEDAVIQSQIFKTLLTHEGNHDDQQ